jgi:hypothetical protein
MMFVFIFNNATGGRATWFLPQLSTMERTTGAGGTRTAMADLHEAGPRTNHP